MMIISLEIPLEEIVRLSSKARREEIRLQCQRLVKVIFSIEKLCDNLLFTLISCFFPVLIFDYLHTSMQMSLQTLEIFI